MSPALVDFYSAAAAVCFVLLGFWWTIVQFRYEVVVRYPPRRRLAYVISLHFAVLGLMSLVALLAEGETLALWQVTFSAGGLLGAAASMLVLFDPGQAGARGQLAFLTHLLAVPLYAALALFAFVPALAREGFGVQPLVAEAIVIALILLVDLHLVWSFFTAIRPDPAPPFDRHPGAAH